MAEPLLFEDYAIESLLGRHATERARTGARSESPRRGLRRSAGQALTGRRLRPHADAMGRRRPASGRLRSTPKRTPSPERWTRLRKTFLRGPVALVDAVSIGMRAIAIALQRVVRGRDRRRRRWRSTLAPVMRRMRRGVRRRCQASSRAGLRRDRPPTSPKPLGRAAVLLVVSRAALAALRPRSGCSATTAPSTWRSPRSNARDESPTTDEARTPRVRSMCAAAPTSSRCS